MLSDATVDAANRAITHVFETTSMAWRTIPHWFTGDPGRSRIRNDNWYDFSEVIQSIDPPTTTLPNPTPSLAEGPYGGSSIKIVPDSEEFKVNLAATTAPNPDQVVSAASAMAVEVVKGFDRQVADQLVKPATQLVQPAKYPDATYDAHVELTVFGTPTAPVVPASQLLGARATLEEAGYFGSRCVWAGRNYFDAFHRVNKTSLILQPCAALLQMSTICRWTPEAGAPDLDALDSAGDLQEASTPVPDTMIIIGRRQEIAPGRAFEAAAGPEPIDLAVSVAPSLEFIGDNQAGQIDLAVRMRYALRFKDNRAVVAWRAKDPK